MRLTNFIKNVSRIYETSLANLLNKLDKFTSLTNLSNKFVFKVKKRKLMIL